MAGSTSPAELLGKLAIGEGTVIKKLIAVSGSFATGDTSKAITVAGVLETDLVLATITGGNTNGVSIEDARPTANTVTITLTGAPGATTPVSILVLRTE
jgi:hypothetical protein